MLILVAAAVVITWLCVRKKDNNQVTVFVAQPGFGEVKPLEGGVLTTDANLWATLEKHQTGRFLKDKFKSTPNGALENFETQAEERLETLQIDSKDASKKRPKEKRRKHRKRQRNHR